MNTVAPLVEEPRTDALAPGTRFYTIVCMVSALVLAVPLLARGVGTGALLPALAGVLLPLARWRAGPLLLIFSFLWLVQADRLGLGPMQFLGRLLRHLLSLFIVMPPGPGFHDNPLPKLARPELMLDVFLVGAIVVYVAAYYRLLGVTRAIFPIDRQRRGPSPGLKSSGVPKFGPILEPKRSASLIDSRELGKLVPAGIIATVLAQYLLLWLQKRSARNDLAPHLPFGLNVQIRDNVWHLLLLLGFLGGGLIVVTSLLGYLGLRRQTPAEAALYLQDQLWRQTRREQARLNRWLAWAEKREARRTKGERGQ